MRRGLIAWGVRQMLAAELQALAAGAAASIANGPTPKPVSPLVTQIYGDSWCAEGSNLQQYVVAASNAEPAAGSSDIELGAGAKASNRNESKAAVYIGWHLAKQVHQCSSELPNCRSTGYQAKGKGQQLDLQLDLNAATSPTGKLNRRAIYVCFTSGGIYLPTGARAEFGLGKVACVSGCSCRPMLLDGNREGPHITAAANFTEVRAAPLMQLLGDGYYEVALRAEAHDVTVLKRMLALCSTLGLAVECAWLVDTCTRSVAEQLPPQGHCQYVSNSLITRMQTTLHAIPCNGNQLHVDSPHHHHHVTH
jgi:hypothetical protein